MVLGTLGTFLGAIICSRFIRLSRAEVDEAQAALQAAWSDDVPEGSARKGCIPVSVVPHGLLNLAGQQRSKLADTRPGGTSIMEIWSSGQEQVMFSGEITQVAPGIGIEVWVTHLQATPTHSRKVCDQLPALVSVEAVAYFSTPYDIVVNLLIIPGIFVILYWSVRCMWVYILRVV